MNESLSITNLEAERQRRQIEHIARLARMGGALPVVEVSVYGRGTDINLGGIKIELEWTELQGAPKTPELYLSREEVEEKLYAVFRDKVVTKALYAHVFKAFEARMGKSNGTVWGYGDTNFCG